MKWKMKNRKRKYEKYIPFYFFNFLFPARVKTSRGMTLIDVIVGTSIMLIVFLGIFGAFKISIELVYSTKAKTGAVSILTERFEHIRSLPYESVGTVGGIPTGAIPQLEEVHLNGVIYIISTLVQYTDAPEDGLDALDENGITADYKTVKVEVVWSVKGSSRSTFAVTRVAPIGQESLEGGGTLRVNVFDQNADAVSGATVRIVNSLAVPAIDVSAETNASGAVSFPGAPGASGYEVYVSKSGYSSAQTYGVTAQNPNPSPIHVSVVESQTTTVSLAIDVNASLNFYTYEPAGPGSFDDTFANGSQLSGTTGVVVLGGALILEEDVDTGYAGSGSAFSTTVSPDYLASWTQVSFASDVPENTALAVSVYYFDGSAYVLVPDSDLAGNSGGFDGGVINVSMLDTATYSALRLGASLSTQDSLITPELLDWSVSYVAGPSPLPNVSFDIRGTKTIGTDSGGQLLYKYEDVFTTNASAEWNIDPVEWDTYLVNLVDVDEYDVHERCPNVVSPMPGEALNVSVMLGVDTARSLRVAVTEGSGAPSVGATVTLTGPVNANGTTGTCGQAYFGALPLGTYAVTISKSGFETSVEDVGVAGETEHVISLLAL